MVTLKLILLAIGLMGIVVVLFALPQWLGAKRKLKAGSCSALPNELKDRIGDCGCGTNVDTCETKN